MDDSLPDYIEESLKQNNFFTNSQGLAIVDCMMNLPLLFWAGEATKDKFFTNVAIAHADTTLKNLSVRTVVFATLIVLMKLPESR